jgi:hypothetical protein
MREDILLVYKLFGRPAKDRTPVLQLDDRKRATSELENDLLMIINLLRSGFNTVQLVPICGNFQEDFVTSVTSFVGGVSYATEIFMITRSLDEKGHIQFLTIDKA